ncbi:MAG TPA: 50S ribosomal protein L11 methyltransferase [Pyrinomonadaceae bacterium]
MNWHAIDLVVCAEAEEAAHYALFEAGAVGTETRPPDERTAEADDVESHCTHVNVSGYFETRPDDEEVRQQLGRAWHIHGLSDAPDEARESPRPDLLYGWHEREVEGRDWLAEWKRSWKPTEVGRFVVAPPWSDVPEGGGRICIRVEPGMAFGTGTHETTRLCLAAIERHFGGGSFLDVGTGTGVLAIAAAKLQPSARVEACDTDPLAVSVAEENARLNGVAERIAFRVGSVDDSTASADLVCANLTADVILPLLPALLGATCGRLVLSGILATQAEQVCARLVELGAAGYEVERDGEWVGITV